MPLETTPASLDHNDFVNENSHLLQHDSYTYHHQGIFLLMSTVIFEICGTLLLKGALQNTYLYAGAFLSYFLSLSIFSIALKYVSLSVAYITWSVLGIVGVTIASHYIFDEKLDLKRFACIAAIILCVIGLY